MHVAIAGNIGSGKTTLTTKLSKHYKWEAHYEDVENNPYLNDFFKNLKNDNQENTVLDIGCGWGSSTVILSKIFKKVYSIDISAKSILAAKENIRLNGFPERVNLSKYDAEKLNFINYFDLIYSWGVIHHSYDTKKNIGKYI